MKRNIRKEIRKQLEAYVKLMKDREDSKPFRIFSPTDDGIYIVEWEGKTWKIMKSYVFKGYNPATRDAIFQLSDEYLPTN